MTGYVRTIQQQAKPIASRLERLDIELTERCNNDCIHCCINRPANDAQARRREMTTSQVNEILRQAADLGEYASQIELRVGEGESRHDPVHVWSPGRGLPVRVSNSAM